MRGRRPNDIGRVGATALVVAVAAGGLPASATGDRVEPSTCRVTLPTHVVRQDAGFSRDAFNYGNGRIRVHLTWSDGVLRAGRLPSGGSVAEANPDGSVYAKVGWWRGVPGRLAITGRRLDRRAPPLRVSLSRDSYPTIGFIPSGLTFPTEGCWRVSGRQGTGALTFVVKVVRLPS